MCYESQNYNSLYGRVLREKFSLYEGIMSKVLSCAMVFALFAGTAGAAVPSDTLLENGDFESTSTPSMGSNPGYSYSPWFQTLGNHSIIRVDGPGSWNFPLPTTGPESDKTNNGAGHYLRGAVPEGEPSATQRFKAPCNGSLKFGASFNTMNDKGGIGRVRITDQYGTSVATPDVLLPTGPSTTRDWMSEAAPMLVTAGQVYRFDIIMSRFTVADDAYAVMEEPCGGGPSNPGDPATPIFGELTPAGPIINPPDDKKIDKTALTELGKYLVIGERSPFGGGNYRKRFNFSLGDPAINDDPTSKIGWNINNTNNDFVGMLATRKEVYDVYLSDEHAQVLENGYCVTIAATFFGWGNSLIGGNLYDVHLRDAPWEYPLNPLNPGNSLETARFDGVEDFNLGPNGDPTANDWALNGNGSWSQSAKLGRLIPPLGSTPPMHITLCRYE